MTASIAVNLGQGIALGTNLALIKRNEDSVRAGRAAFLIGACQSAQANIAATYVTYALEAYRVTEIPTSAATIIVRVALTVLPFFLAFGIQHGIANDTVRHICLFVQDHIGDLSQIISLVSAVALIVFGQIALGAASLTFIVLGALDRYGFFPETVSYYFRQLTMPLMIMSSILTGGIVEKLFATINILAIGYQQYHKWQNRDAILDFENREERIRKEQETFMATHPELLPQAGNSTVPLHSGLLTPQIVKQILACEKPLKVNPLHLKAPINVQASGATQIDTLLKSFDGVEWTHENMQGLRTKLLEDDRFRELRGVATVEDFHIKGVRDQDLVIYARKQLEQFIQQVKARHVSAGAIHEYDRLETYLKTIVELLSSLDDPRDRASYIARLAVEGGQYCGPGRFHAVEEIWALLLWNKKDIPLGTKILFLLQDVRTQKVREVYQQIAGRLIGNNCWQKSLKYLGIIPTDIHLYNQIIMLYGTDFGFRSEAAKNDELAFVDPLQRIAVQTLINQLKEGFSLYYTVDYLVEQIQKKIGDKLLPKSDIFTWWSHWMVKQDKANKTMLQDVYLDSGTLFGERLEIENAFLEGADSEFSSHFIKAMLFDMGIVEFAIAEEGLVLTGDEQVSIV